MQLRARRTSDDPIVALRWHLAGAALGPKHATPPSRWRVPAIVAMPGVGVASMGLLLGEPALAALVFGSASSLLASLLASLAPSYHSNCAATSLPLIDLICVAATGRNYHGTPGSDDVADAGVTSPTDQIGWRLVWLHDLAETAGRTDWQVALAQLALHIHESSVDEHADLADQLTQLHVEWVTTQLSQLTPRVDQVAAEARTLLDGTAELCGIAGADRNDQLRDIRDSLTRNGTTEKINDADERVTRLHTDAEQLTAQLDKLKQHVLRLPGYRPFASDLHDPYPGDPAWGPRDSEPRRRFQRPAVEQPLNDARTAAEAAASDVAVAAALLSRTTHRSAAFDSIERLIAKAQATRETDRHDGNVVALPAAARSTAAELPASQAARR